MNISDILLVGAGFLLGNPPARERFGKTIQELAGNGIDILNNLNKAGGVAGAVQSVLPDAEHEA